LAWRAKSEGKIPVVGETVNAFGKVFTIVGSYGNKIIVKSHLDGIQVSKGQLA
jgi:hypothetical protein